MLPDVPVLSAAAVARGCDLLVLSVSDLAIEPSCGELAAGGDLHSGQFVLHVSGAYGLKILAPAVEVGAVPVALHPAMTFPGQPNDADQFPGLAFAITTPPAVRAEVEQLVRDLGGVPIWINDDDRVLYHAALVLGANNLVTVVTAALEALSAAQVANPEQILAPLLRASLENALRIGDRALTGPIRRADTATIEAHLSALRDRTPELALTYLQLGLVTARRARRVALDNATDLDRVVALLEGQVAQEHSRGGD